MMDWDKRELALVSREISDGALANNVAYVEVFVFDARDAPRGFGRLLPETQRAICAKGGRNAHAAGLAYEWDSEAAKVAGRKGATASRAKAAAR
jgi:general stress protein YciG